METERLAALARYEVLDTEDETAFDDLARLAALVCGTPTALITLIDERRQWFKARVNFDLHETPRAIAFCDHTIRGRDVVVIEDAERDPRFANNPLVTGKPAIRFYAGAPLIAGDGNAIGSIAVIDYTSRTVTAEQQAALQILARQVVDQLDLRLHALHARRETEDEVRRSIERFELLARATNDVIWDWDLRTNDIWWNDAFERVYGKPEVRFDAWLARVHPDDADAVQNSLQEVVASTRTDWKAEYRFLRKDGTYANVFDRGYVMRDRTGLPLRMIGAMIDLSERITLEQQVIRAQRMQALGQLAGGVAHDVNNILTIIECNAYLLRRGGAPTGHVEEIVHAVDRAASLTRQLLLVSRNQPMRRVAVVLNEVVGNMSQMLGRVLGEHIDLRVTTDPQLAAIEADVSMIEQVLLNLAVNARDAMPRGGVLSIQTSTAMVQVPRTLNGLDLVPGMYATLSVSDTGTGIPPLVMPRIFEAFFTTKATGKGSGLGLSTVLAIARQHHGAVDVHTGSSGTTFVVYLPIATAETAAAAAGASPLDDLPRGSETLLVVEDEPVVRGGVTMLLRACGYTVLDAPSAAMAIEIWQAERDRIALVLTDLAMPGGMSGRDLAARLRAVRPDLPIIYTSGYSDEYAQQGEPLVEGENYLEKPYPPIQLAQLVRARLDAQRQTGPR